MYYIGVDIGGTNVKIGIVDDEGVIIGKLGFAIRKGNNGADLLEDLKVKIPELLNSTNIIIHKIKGIGVGIPGAINTKKGTVDYNGNIGWRDFEIVKGIEDLFHKPVKIANDANAATLGEAKFGAGESFKDVIMITIGTGVGGGIIVDGKLVEGNEGKGAELGHTVIKVGGEKCTCGRRGCYEAYASATALVRMTKTAMEKNKDSIMWESCLNNLDNANPRTAFDCAKKGDKAAAKVVNEYVKYLSEGILDFCNIFRPQAILIGGGVSGEGNYLLDKVRAYCEKFDYGFKTTPKVEILRASMGNDAGIVGAAALLMD